MYFGSIVAFTKAWHSGSRNGCINTGEWELMVFSYVIVFSWRTVHMTIPYYIAWRKVRVAKMKNPKLSFLVRAVFTVGESDLVSTDVCSQATRSVCFLFLQGIGAQAQFDQVVD